MAKKGSRLREFEKNNRVLDITGAQQARKQKRRSDKEKKAVLRDDQIPTKKDAIQTNDGNKKKKVGWVKLIGIAISFVFIVIVGMSVKNIFDLKAKEDVLLDKQAELKNLKEELTMELENVNSDEYIEAQARKSLKLVKGNELIFFFSEDDTDSKKVKDKDQADN